MIIKGDKQWAAEQMKEISFLRSMMASLFVLSFFPHPTSVGWRKDREVGKATWYSYPTGLGLGSEVILQMHKLKKEGP